MTVALYTHMDMFDHRPGEGHPERSERLRSVTDALADSTLDLAPHEAPLVDEADLLKVHDRAYLDAIARLAPAFAMAEPWRPMIIGLGLFTMLL